MKHVLYINSYNPGYSWSDDIENGLLTRLEKSGKNIEVSREYLDGKRFVNRGLTELKAYTIYAKYAEYPFDLIVLSDNIAFDFATRQRDRFFPGIPIVFCGYNAFRQDILKGLSDITGVNEEVDLDGLIQTVLHIQPKLRTMVFILSTCVASGIPIAHKVETDIIPNYKDKYEIVVLKNATMPEIRAALSHLPENSAVFLAGRVCETGRDREATPAESGRLISDASPVPVYTFWKFYLGTGVLGGRILSGLDQGEAAADIALQILDGKAAGTIPVVMHSPTRNIFDYNVMQRFDINEKYLPADSIVINKPFSFYEAYKKLVWSAIGVLSILLLLIMVLLFNIFERLRAEKELQQHRDRLEALIREKTADLVKSNEALADSEKRYRELFENINSGVAVYEVKDNGKDFIFRDFNRAGEKIDQNKRENLLGKSIFQVRPGIENFGLIDVFRCVWETGEPAHHPVSLYEDSKLEGWYENYVYKLSSNEIVAVFENVTEKKQMELSLKESEERYRLLFHQSPIGVVHTDMEGVVVDVNDAYAEMIGITRDDLIGLDVLKLLTDPALLKAVNDALNGGIGHFAGEMASVLTGQKLSCNITTQGVWAPDGCLIGGVAIVENMTAQKELQEALRRSESYLRQAQAVAGVGSWHLDILNNILSWSDQTYKMFGVKQRTLLNVSGFLEYVHPEDRVVVESAWREALNGKSYDMEHRIMVNGGIRWVHEKAQVKFKKDGDPVEAVGTVHDITERRTAEEKIKRASEEWERTFNTVPDLIAILDDQFRIVRANKAMADKLGISAEEAVGKTCYEFIHGTDGPPAFCPHKQLLADGKEHSDEIFEERLGGDFIVNVSPLFDAEGQIIGSVHTAHDITERKRVERALQESEEKFRAIFDQAAVGVSLTSTRTGKFLQVNRKYSEIVGYSEDELNRINFQEISHLDDLKVDLANMQKLKEGNVREFSMEKRFIRKDSSEVWVNLTVSPMWDAGQEPTTHIAVIEDITERKMMEAKVKTLSGLLPICASCKKIRDDKGYWNQIESYISEYSSAEFSHSMCPECSDKYYGDQEWYIKMKKKKNR